MRSSRALGRTPLGGRLTTTWPPKRHAAAAAASIHWARHDAGRNDRSDHRQCCRHCRHCRQGQQPQHFRYQIHRCPNTADCPGGGARDSHRGCCRRQSDQCELACPRRYRPAGATIVFSGTQRCLFVAAAGNNGGNNTRVPTLPASYDFDNMVVVMASDENDDKAWFSNYLGLHTRLPPNGAFLARGESERPKRRPGQLESPSTWRAVPAA